MDASGDSLRKDSKDELIPETGKETGESGTNDEDCIIFHCVTYLGASSIESPKNEDEIQQVISFLNGESSGSVIQVSVSVPTYSDGFVVIYEENNQQEISRFAISQMMFFARGSSSGSDGACFGFTYTHRSSHESVIFQCHAFRCDVPEAVGRVFKSFIRAFEAPMKDKQGSVAKNDQNTHSMCNLERFLFEVTLEVKEDDGKGNFSSVPREKGYFKLKSGVAKHIVLTVQQLPDLSRDLIFDRCFGILLSPGRHVRSSDMQLVDMLSWSVGSNSNDKRSYVVITGQWEANDPAFELLNEETSKDSHVFFTVAVDLVIKGIQEPIRFVMETKAKIYPSSERFWNLTRKHHSTQQFELSFTKVEGTSAESRHVINVTSLGEVDKAKMNFNLNFTSFIRSSSIGSLDLDTPTPKDEESDDDEPLQSGMGEVSKECSDEQITLWSDILAYWHADSLTKPKQLADLVRAGIPNTIRGEIWLRLSKASNDKALFETYKSLLNKDCANEDIIKRDITRTFPANDYFKDSESAGQELLLNISKAYSLYDAEVGYCQGISFIGAALLLQMPEEQSFVLLVKIMCEYNFRELYRDGFEDLHLRLYQLDRLIEDQIPELHVHFKDLDLQSHMYASQWFLTLYTAKFPLPFVFRVLDLFLLDGTKVIFQIALALLVATRKDLLVLDFEGILKYFRISLPKKFRKEAALGVLIKKAVQVKVNKLKKYKTEYLQLKEEEKSYVDPQTRLANENKKLMEEKLRFEHTVTNLVLSKTATEETLAATEEEMSKLKMTLKETEDFNSRLKEEANSVKELLQREIKQYELDAEKKEKIIVEYKKICSTLSTQMEQKEQLFNERLNFFKTNLCAECTNFTSMALHMVSKAQENGENDCTNISQKSVPLTVSVGDHVKSLENELAKTKIALAEAECTNEDLSHQLVLAQTELESTRNNSKGPAKLWKNLKFQKESKKAAKSGAASPEDSSTSSISSTTSVVKN